MPTHTDLPSDNSVMESKSSGSAVSGGGGNNRNLIAAFSYLGGPVTGVAMLLIEKSDAYVRFHALQSTITFGFLILANIAIGYLPLGGFTFLLSQFFSMVCVIVWFVVVFKAYSGEEYELPFFGALTRKQLQNLLF